MGRRGHPAVARLQVRRGVSASRFEQAYQRQGHPRRSDSEGYLCGLSEGRQRTSKRLVRASVRMMGVEQCDVTRRRLPPVSCSLRALDEVSVEAREGTKRVPSSPRRILFAGNSCPSTEAEAAIRSRAANSSRVRLVVPEGAERLLLTLAC